MVLQGQRQPCCSSFLLLFTASNQGKRGSECGRAGGRQGGLSASVSPWKLHTHPPLGQRDSGGRLGSVSRCLRLLLSPLPPLPRRTDRRRENARNETSAQALFTCALTNKRRRVLAFVFFCLPLGFVFLMYLFKWRPRGSEAALLAFCGPSTEPVSTSQEPAAQTPRPSHLGKLS